MHKYYLSKINFSKKEINSKYITKDYDALIEILNKVNEDTRFIPIENLLYLTKLSKENSLYIPLHHLTPVLKFILKISMIIMLDLKY